MRLLLTSTQHPGNGGAATNLYKLNKYFLERNIQVYCLFLLCNKEDTEIIDVDPERVGNVSSIRCFWKDGRLLDYDKSTGNYLEYTAAHIDGLKHKIVDHLGGEPDTVWAKNYLAPITSKLLFPTAKIHYLVSGVYFMSLLNNFSDKPISAQKVLDSWDTYRDYIHSHRDKVDYTNITQELKTISSVDGVIFNSRLTERLMRSFYGDAITRSEMRNTSLLNNYMVTGSNISDRKYDVIFVCSQLWRKIKNASFVKKLFLDKRLDPYNKLVIGDGDIFDSLEIPNLTVIQQQPNSVVLDRMRESKLLVLPSLFDSSPNTLYEAVECGCNILTSKNIGNWHLLNPKSVCDDVYDKEEWLSKIELGLTTTVPNCFTDSQCIAQGLEDSILLIRCFSCRIKQLPAEGTDGRQGGDYNNNLFATALKDDFYTDLLMDIRDRLKVKRFYHALVDDNYRDEYTYPFSDDNAYRSTFAPMCSSSIGNKDIIHVRTTNHHLGRYSGNILFLRGDYSEYNLDMVRNYRNVIYYAAGRTHAKTCKWDDYVTLFLYDDMGSLSYERGMARFSNAVAVPLFKFSSRFGNIVNTNIRKDIKLLVVLKDKNYEGISGFELVSRLLSGLSAMGFKHKILVVGAACPALLNCPKSIDITVHNRVNRQQLNTYYNRSEYMFVPTVADGNPRIISEAVKCGATVIATSLLEAGKDNVASYGGHIVDVDDSFEQSVYDILMTKWRSNVAIYESCIGRNVDNIIRHMR